MVWTVIPDSEIDPDSPITTGLMTAYRDNFAAMANGDSGAPSIALAAMSISQWGGEYIRLSDTTAVSTEGGTFTGGAWQTRRLNSEDIDTGAHCNIASNQFTLSAGTYLIYATAPAFEVTSHKAKLTNITDASDILIGTASRSQAASGAMNRSIVQGLFTIGVAKALEIQHYSGATKTTNGFGSATGFSNEVYTVVELVKVG